MNPRACGELALRVAVPDLATAHRLAGCARHWPEVSDVVPAPDTVLFRAAGPVGRDRIAARLAALPATGWGTAAAAPAGPPRSHELPTRYDGADLAALAQLSARSIAEVIELHATGRYRVDFLGFAPGFGYLSGLHPALRRPRRDTPRTRVPAGTVAVAGAYTAVYPTASAGGWWLLGHTDVRLFDPAQDPPARFAPGDRITFQPVD